MKYSLYTIAACVLILFCGCEEPDTEKDYAGKDIVCDNLYQGDSIEDAVTFLGTPDEARKSSLRTIERRGKLASGEELKFANRVFDLRRSRNTENFSVLLSQKMRSEIGKDNFLDRAIGSIKDGHFIYYECEDGFHGNCDAKFLATFGEVSENPAKGSKYFYFPQVPTHQLLFYHFHNPNYMTIGTTFHLIQEDGDYKIVEGFIRDMEMPESDKRVRVVPVVTSGIEKKDIDKWSDKSYDQWHIGLTEADNKNNIIEIVKTVKVTSGEKELDHNKAEELVVDYDSFKKYVEVWDDVRFKFSLLIKLKSENSYGTDTGGLSYIFRIASGSITSTLKYPGMKISDVSIKEKSAFVNGEMELLTFDSIGKAGTVYRNRVLVRLTKKGSQ